jgi:hypothetical protein
MNAGMNRMLCCVCLLTLIGSAQGALVVDAVNEYAPGTRPIYDAPGSAFTAAYWETELPTVYANGTGGTWNMEQQTGSSDLEWTLQFDGGNKAVSFTFDHAMGPANFGSAGEISGSYLLDADPNSNDDITMSIGAVTGQANTYITRLALGAVQRLDSSAGGPQAWTVTATYSDTTTTVLTDTIGGTGVNEDNTHFAFEAPSNAYITQIQFSVSAPSESYVLLDDISFDTEVVPEPTTLGLLGLGLGGLLGRRLRRA